MDANEEKLNRGGRSTERPGTQEQENTGLRLSQRAGAQPRSPTPKVKLAGQGLAVRQATKRKARSPGSW